MNAAERIVKKRESIIRQRESFMDNFRYMNGGELAEKALEYRRMKKLAKARGNMRLAEHCDQMVAVLKKKMKEKKESL